MNAQLYIPSSRREAAQFLRTGRQTPPTKMSRGDFILVWSSVAYLYPGLHPDGFDDTDSGWPAALRPFACEAVRRAENGELADEQLYPSDAQWAGIYDRMTSTTPQETARRAELARVSVV
jgi:hypothetical protein